MNSKNAPETGNKKATPIFLNVTYSPFIKMIAGAIIILVLIGILYIGFGIMIVSSWGPQDYIKKGVSQADLRRHAYFVKDLPDTVTVLKAQSTGGKDPTKWILISSPQPMDEAFISIDRTEFKPSAFSLSQPPRDFPQDLKVLIDLLAPQGGHSWDWSRTEPRRDDGIWLWFDQRKQVLLICTYSS